MENFIQFYGVFCTTLKIKNRQNNHQENRVIIVQLCASIKYTKGLLR